MSANPVVYFIDDSATMREVIKIAFRRENINVIACHDAGSAIGLMDETAPDVVISDVIMPEKDGYEVCQYIKQHPTMGQTPVILMSGVVNRSVAEKAFAVKAPRDRGRMRPRHRRRLHSGRAGSQVWVYRSADRIHAGVGIRFSAAADWRHAHAGPAVDRPHHRRGGSLPAGAGH